MTKYIWEDNPNYNRYHRSEYVSDMEVELLLYSTLCFHEDVGKKHPICTFIVTTNEVYDLSLFRGERVSIKILTQNQFQKIIKDPQERTKVCLKAVWEHLSNTSSSWLRRVSHVAPYFEKTVMSQEMYRIFKRKIISQFTENQRKDLMIELDRLLEEDP